MGSMRLGVGTEWRLDGRPYRILRQLAADQFVACDLTFQLERTVTTSEVLSLYVAGQLQFLTAEEDAARTNPDEANAASTVLKDLTPHERRAIARRWKAIEPLTQLGRTPTAEEFRARADALRGARGACSERSLRRYWRSWFKANQDRMALLPRTARRGQRGQTRRNSLFKQQPVLRRIVEEAIQAVYLTLARRPISAVTRRVLEDLQRHNARLPAAQAIPLPRPATLERAIGRWIHRLDPWEVDRARWGRKIADRRHQPTQARQLARRILQRVEIDHSPLKVIVGTEAGPLGQPWLTILIDYYSRMVIGCCLGFEPPSYGVILEALRHAILPKTYLAEKYPRINGTWPCFGLPETLVCDRGTDFASQDLEQAAFQLGFELDFLPPRTPHFKGTVESFFDGLNDQLLSALPGRTFRSWERRADYHPEAGPLITYQALLEIMHLYLVDVYAISRHPTASRSRLEMWQESAAEFPPSLPASPEQLVVLLAKQVERTLSNRGIELSGMFYNSPALMDLRAELAAQNLPIEKFTIRYNPWDLGELWVLNPLTKSYLRAPALDPTMREMTEYQWRILKRAIRERFDEPDHLQSLAAGRNAIRDAAEAAVHKPTRKPRTKAARFLHPEFQSGDAAFTQTTEPAEWIDVGVDGPHPPASTERRLDIPDAQSEAHTTPVDPNPDVDPDELDVDDWDVVC